MAVVSRRGHHDFAFGDTASHCRLNLINCLCLGFAFNGAKGHVDHFNITFIFYIFERRGDAGQFQIGIILIRSAAAIGHKLHIGCSRHPGDTLTVIGRSREDAADLGAVIG